MPKHEHDQAHNDTKEALQPDLTRIACGNSAAVISQGLSLEEYEQAADDLRRQVRDLREVRVVSIIGQTIIEKAKKNPQLGIMEDITRTHGSTLGGVMLASVLTNRSFSAKHPYISIWLGENRRRGRQFSDVEHLAVTIEQLPADFGAAISGDHALELGLEGYVIAVVPGELENRKPLLYAVPDLAPGVEDSSVLRDTAS